MRLWRTALLRAVVNVVASRANMGTCFCGVAGPVRKFSHWHAADDCERYVAAICDAHFGGMMTDQIMRHITAETKRRNAATRPCVESTSCNG